MKTCHNCPHAPRIAANEFENVDWEQTPCSKCELVLDSSQTKEFDENHALCEFCWPSPEEVAVADRLPISVLAEALRGFLELPPRVFRAVQLRFKGESYALIAKELEVTPQAVEVQLKRALEAHPYLKSLLPEKAKRHDARMRRRRSAARRGKPGVGVTRNGN